MGGKKWAGLGGGGSERQGVRGVAGFGGTFWEGGGGCAGAQVFLRRCAKLNKCHLACKWLGQRGFGLAGRGGGERCA